MLLALQQNLLLGEVPTLVEVPDVVGQSQASGTTELEGEGFDVAVSTAYSDVVAAGTIISQSPTAGSDAIEGSTVTITVSLGVFQRIARARISLDTSKARFSFSTPSCRLRIT